MLRLFCGWSGLLNKCKFVSLPGVIQWCYVLESLHIIKIEPGLLSSLDIFHKKNDSLKSELLS